MNIVFHKYPEKELRITGILFGMLIQHQLVSSITLGIACYVLEAYINPIANSKMFQFGIFTLNEFKNSSRNGRSIVRTLCKLSTKYEPQGLVDEIKRAMQSSQGSGNGEDSSGGIDGVRVPSLDGDASSQPQPSQSIDGLRNSTHESAPVRRKHRQGGIERRKPAESSERSRCAADGQNQHRCCECKCGGAVEVRRSSRMSAESRLEYNGYYACWRN